MNVYEPLPPGFNPLARITPALTLRKEKVASITAMIFFHIILHPAVLIYVIYGGVPFDQSRAKVNSGKRYLAQK